MRRSLRDDQAFLRDSAYRPAPIPALKRGAIIDSSPWASQRDRKTCTSRRAILVQPVRAKAEAQHTYAGVQSCSTTEDSQGACPKPRATHHAAGTTPGGAEQAAPARTDIGWTLAGQWRTRLASCPGVDQSGKTQSPWIHRLLDGVAIRSRRGHAFGLAPVQAKVRLATLMFASSYENVVSRERWGQRAASVRRPCDRLGRRRPSTARSK